MGMVSYIEDIRKIRDDAEHFRQSITSGINSNKENNVRALKDASLRIACYERNLASFINKLDKYLAIATDPVIDLVSENVTLKIQLEDCLKEVAQVREKLATVEEHTVLRANKLAAQLSHQRELVAKETKRARRAESAFERLAGKDFDAALRAYPPKPADSDLKGG
jgi:hypothetical protein